MYVEDFRDIEMLRKQFNKFERYFDIIEMKLGEKRGCGPLSIHKYSKEDIINCSEFDKIAALRSNISDLVQVRVQKHPPTQYYIDKYEKMCSKVEMATNMLKKRVLNRKNTFLEGAFGICEALVFIVARLPVIRDMVRGVAKLLPSNQIKMLGSSKD